MLAGGVVAVLFAAAVAVPMLRFRGLYFTIGSLVLAEALGIFMSNFGGFGGNMGITLSGTAPSPETIYLLSFVVAVLATGIVAGLVRSRLGLGLRAIRDDEDVAERVGVLTFRTKLTVFLIASFVMGLVGGIQAEWTGYIEPTGAFALDWTVETVNAAIIGGVGTIVGPLLGSGISVGLSQRLASYPTVHLIILGALLIVVIRLAPNGLWGAACQLARAGQRRFLGRSGAAAPAIPDTPAIPAVTPAVAPVPGVAPVTSTTSSATATAAATPATPAAGVAAAAPQLARPPHPPPRAPQRSRPQPPPHLPCCGRSAWARSTAACARWTVWTWNCGRVRCSA